jgi:hypothetical protein
VKSGDFGEPDFGEKPADMLSNTEEGIPYRAGYPKVPQIFRAVQWSMGDT